LEIFSPPYPRERSVRAGISLIALAATIALLYYGRDFFVTLCIAALFAFILDPAVLLVMKLRIPRGAATAIVIGIASVATYAVFAAAWTQISTLAEDLPTYSTRVSEIVASVNARVDEIGNKTVDMLIPKDLREQQQQIEQKPQEAQKARRKRRVEVETPPAPPAVQPVRIVTDPRPVITTLYRYVSGYFHVLVMASFIPFLVYFMLSWRDHISRAFLSFFPGQEHYSVGKSWAGIGDSTRAFVIGNFLLWLLLSSASAIAFFLLGIPYWPLVGPLSAFFALIPYVGLPISMLVPVLAALAVPNRFKIVLTAALITAALDLFTMNLLYAKVIGHRVRLNPLFVTLALMFWGLLWGGVGLILAVPITAAIKAVCDNVESLEPYGRILGDDQRI
jgi:predicted PurR-regulated permease PerM